MQHLGVGERDARDDDQRSDGPKRQSLTPRLGEPLQENRRRHGGQDQSEHRFAPAHPVCGGAEEGRGEGDDERRERAGSTLLAQVGSQRPAAETNHFAAGIADFENYPMTKNVDRAPTVFAVAGDAGCDDLVDRVGLCLQLIERPSPFIGRKSNAEALPLVRAKPAALQVSARVRAA